jgi:hypothetical protein
VKSGKHDISVAALLIQSIPNRMTCPTLPAAKPAAGEQFLRDTYCGATLAQMELIQKRGLSKRDFWNAIQFV